MGKDTLIAYPINQPEVKKENTNPFYADIKPAQLLYKVNLPENSDIVKTLQENDVAINVKKNNESGSFGLGSSLITILLVLGFFALIIRSIQSVE